MTARKFVVTLRTRCKCERTFAHWGDVTREWVVPIPPPPSVAGELLEWPPTNDANYFARQCQVRRFELVSIDHQDLPMPHLLYEEAP